MKKQKAFLFLVPLLLALPACTSVKKELGVGRNSPDEFLVVKRAPLTMPPDYALRPPQNPNEAPPATESSDEVKSALLGTKGKDVQTGKGDALLLQKAGASTANPDIRKVIDEENGYISLQNRTLANKLISWDDEDQSPSIENVPASVVDPAKEAERLKQNKEEGKAVNEGNVPVIEKKSSTLDKIF